MSEVRSRARFLRFIPIGHPLFTQILAALLGAALGITALALLGAGIYRVGPLRVRLAITPDIRGKTVIEVPPLGSVEASTHAAPLRISAWADQVVIDEVERFAEQRPNAEDVLDEISASVRANRLRLAVRVLLLGTLGGLVAAIVIRGGLKLSLSAVVAGALVPLLLVGLTAIGYQPRAFSEPTLNGALSAAPDFLGPVGELGERFEAYRRQLELVGNTVFKVYRFLSERSDLPRDAIRVLHISDLHLNPVGYDLARSVAGTFQVEAVFDTGDTVAEGRAIENGFLEPIRQFAVPYVWIRGNHDSDQTQSAVAGIPNAIVLDGDMQQIAGLWVFGVGDPIFTPGREPSFDTSEQTKMREEFAPRVREMYDALGITPDVVMVHSEVIAEDIAGDVPLVLYGHGHRFETSQTDGTTFVQVGSTGGAGLPSLAPGEGTPNALQVLYFDRNTKELLAIDRIQVLQEGARFSVDRIEIALGREPEAVPVLMP